MPKMSIWLAAILVLLTTTLSQRAIAQSDLVNGRVTKIDESAGKITIQHGPMPKFDLNEGHTMVFRVADPAILKQVKAGDQIKFEADRVNGQFTVTKVQKDGGTKK